MDKPCHTTPLNAAKGERTGQGGLDDPGASPAHTGSHAGEKSLH